MRDDSDVKIDNMDVDRLAIETVLDSLDALVYVADMNTHELLFLNAYGRAEWGDVGGRKCWQVLQSGQTGPCAFCNNALLLDVHGKPSGVQVWEFRNTHNNRWYQCRDQAIRWPDGRLVRMEIATDITDLKDLQTQLTEARLHAEQLANEDPLTGLANRRALFALGQHAIEQARRQQLPVALIALDVDRFKRINDGYGHAAGDAVLQALADQLKAHTRAADIVARLGGEEFAVLLPGTGQTAACELAERLRTSVAGLSVCCNGQDIGVSCSFGVTSSENGAASLEQMLNAADLATYRAKAGGRNQVEEEVCR
ncbi:MAG: GGDEF domain-containing protein [Pseudomonadaceae bacterium]